MRRLFQNPPTNAIIATVSLVAVAALAVIALGIWPFADPAPPPGSLPINLSERTAVSNQDAFQQSDETEDKLESRKKRVRSRFWGANVLELAGELAAPDGASQAIPSERLEQFSQSGLIWDKALDATFSAGEGDDPLRRERQFWEARSYPVDAIPADIHAKAIQVELSRPAANAAEGSEAAPTWSNLGPNPLRNITYAGQSEQNASGRAIAMAVHPTDANQLLLGAAQGGIWKSTDAGASWKAVGEGMPSLAVKVIRYAPSNPNVVYAGTGEPHSSTSIYGQGVLKSTDGGSTWTALPAQGPGWNFRYASVSGLQVDPNNANIVYVTTAAIRTALYSFNPANPPQTGIFKSTDGGSTWTLLKAAKLYTSPFPSYQGNVGFMDLELARSNPNRLYATEYFGGIYRSDDAGATWNRVSSVKSGGGADLPAPVADFGYFAYDFSYQIADFFILDRFNLRSDLPEFTRIELGLSQSDPDVLYAGVSAVLLLDVDGSGTFDAQDIITPAGLVFKSTNGGSTWTWLGDWPRNSVPNYCATQCDYDNTVEVNPADPNDVVLGGSANYNPVWPDPKGSPTRYLRLPWRGMLHRTLNGGASWIDITPHCIGVSGTPAGTFNGKPLHTCSPNAASRVIHPDIHAMVYDPHNSAGLYTATDGGLHRATIANSGANSSDYTWENLNNQLSTLQFYSFDVHPTNPNIMLGGLQDNSNAYWNGITWEGWGFGDGTFGAFDPNNPNYVYIGTQFNIHRHDSGGAKRALDANGNPINGWNLAIFQPQSGDAPTFLVPFEIDPVSSTTIYAGSSTGLYRSSNRGASWSVRLNSSAFIGTPTTISVSPANHNLVYTGTSTGEIYLFDFGTNSYSPVDSGLPKRYVSKLQASPNQANTVYVALSGYNANTPAAPGKIFKSTDRGVKWTDISGNLPDVPVSALAIDPNNEQRMWVGTDVGVFVTTNGGGTWSSFRGNMPVVAIMDMKYNQTTGYLSVVTHGRGAWRVSIEPSAVAGWRVLLPAVLRAFGGGASPTPTPTVPPPSLPVFQNANFEQGNNGAWDEYSLLFDTIITNEFLPFTPHSGSWLAWEGGEDGEISSLSQTVFIPKGLDHVYLAFYFQIMSNESNCNASLWSDAFLLDINGSFAGGFVLCSANNTDDWMIGYLSDNLADYGGQNLNFDFQVETDSSMISSFFIDDVHFLNSLPIQTSHLLEPIPSLRPADQPKRDPGEGVTPLLPARPSGAERQQ